MYPYSDINRSSYLYLFLAAGTLIALITISIVISNIGARRIYTPFAEIADMFKRPNSDSNNILEFIKSSIAENIDANSIQAQEAALTLIAYKE